MGETAVVTEIPGVCNTFVGELVSRTPTEVDMEGFFSICGHVSDARRLMQEIRLYERLVIGKHRLLRIYLSKEKKSSAGSWNVSRKTAGTRRKSVKT